MSSTTVYFNGSFVPEDEAKVTVYDGGWLHGAGLFETMRAENGRVFRLDAHLERLRGSAVKLLLPIEPDALPTPEDFSELLRRNDHMAGGAGQRALAGALDIDIVLARHLEDRQTEGGIDFEPFAPGMDENHFRHEAALHRRKDRQSSDII